MKSKKTKLSTPRGAQGVGGEGSLAPQPHTVKILNPMPTNGFDAKHDSRRVLRPLEGRELEGILQ